MIKYIVAWGITFYLLPLTHSVAQWYSVLATTYLVITYINISNGNKALIALSTGSVLLCFTGFFDGGILLYKHLKFFDIRLFDALWFIQLYLSTIYDRRLPVLNNDDLLIDNSIY